jgi:hypothetical protein
MCKTTRSLLRRDDKKGEDDSKKGDDRRKGDDRPDIGMLSKKPCYAEPEPKVETSPLSFGEGLG